MASKIEIKKSLCTWCKGECGVLIHVKDDHMVKAAEDPDWPRKVWPATRACVRLKAAKEWFYHPDRVDYPMKRAAGKGEGKWQVISWGQALDEIADKIDTLKKQYGAESIASSSGTGYRTEEPPRTRFLQLLGSPNNPGMSQICFGARSIMANTIVGMYHNFAMKPTTKCIVLLGCEPIVSRPILANVMRQARKNGAKLITLDPRRTRSAEDSDVWLQVRPGTDCAILLAMINVIIAEDLYDHEFVDKWCHGFAQIKDRAAKYSPVLAEQITTVPADKIVAAARMYATNKPGVMIEGMGIEHLQNNSDIFHARWILAAITGNIDVAGGEELYGHHPYIKSMGESDLTAKLSALQKSKSLGGDRFRLFSWEGFGLVAEATKKAWGRPSGAPMLQARAHGPMVYRAMATGKPYPIRALLTIASNPMITQANTKLLYKALKSLDLHVVMDFWMTPGAELADYVLPAASWMERPILWDFVGYSNCMISGEAALPAVIPGEYDHRTDFEFYRGLGIRLGQGEFWPWKTLEEFYDSLVKPMGMTHHDYVHQMRLEYKALNFKKYETKGFGTPTGKVELYSTTLEKLGYDPLPDFRESAETKVSEPQTAKEYPYTLITGGRVREYYHSESRQIDPVRARHPQPLVQIHPDTAAKLGITEGDWVWIETKRGRVRQKAALFDGLAPDVVHAEFGWWFPELPGEDPWLHGVFESNINVVMNDDPDACNPVIGTWPLRTALCKIYKVKSY